MKNCPKCDADVSESHQSDEPDVGIVGGYYCDACDLAIADDEDYHEDDVPLFGATKDPIEPSSNGICKYCSTPLEPGYGLAGGGGLGPYMYCPKEMCGRTFIKFKDTDR